MVSRALDEARQAAEKAWQLHDEKIEAFLALGVTWSNADYHNHYNDPEVVAARDAITTAAEEAHRLQMIFNELITA